VGTTSRYEGGAMRIVLVDDHTVVRDGIKWMLANEPGIEIVGEAGTGRALLALLETVAPDVILLDVRMPGLSGLETLDALRDAGSESAVLMLTMYAEPELVASAIERGASGYVLKSANRDELISAIEVVGAGGSYLQGELTGPLVRRVSESDGTERAASFTHVECDILRLVADGLGNRQIAIRMAMPESSVKTAMRQIFGKLGAHGRSEAVAVAMRRGLIN
jgi:DNA-binding NarL/FixJ family response regulator